ncbi:MAG: hypothetical protein JNL79_12910 [Myxococcales bacterium]|nr:hypothetical protein [Myxococcales bacterium]
MADREALYREIVAHDDDVDTQLVLADALIDLGDPRGRLLAVQRALELDPWNADLQRDEVRLIDRHADAFLGPLALHRYDDGLELTWHRGFVRGAAIDEHHVASSRLLDELLQIPAVEALSALRLGHVLDFEGCRACLVARRPALRRLEYGIDRHGKAVFEVGMLAPLLEVLPTLETFVGPGGDLGRIRLPNVRTFDLRYLSSDLSALVDAEWPLLESLRLGGTTFDYGFVDFRPLLDALGATPHLRELALFDMEDWDYAFGDPTPADTLVEHLAGSPVLARLRRFELDGRIGTAGVTAILEAAPRFAHLEDLVLTVADVDVDLRDRLSRVGPRVRLHPPR